MPSRSERRRFTVFCSATAFFISDLQSSYLSPSNVYSIAAQPIYCTYSMSSIRAVSAVKTSSPRHTHTFSAFAYPYPAQGTLSRSRSNLNPNSGSSPNASAARRMASS